MALFGSSRDISMFRKINRELLGDIITQQVAIYKYILDKTKVNMYGESVEGRNFADPVLLFALIYIIVKCYINYKQRRMRLILSKCMSQFLQRQNRERRQNRQIRQIQRKRQIGETINTENIELLIVNNE